MVGGKKVKKNIYILFNHWYLAQRAIFPILNEKQHTCTERRPSTAFESSRNLLMTLRRLIG